MGLKMTFRDTQSQVQYEQKSIHVRDTIMARGYLWDLIKHNINS